MKARHLQLTVRLLIVSVFLNPLSLRAQYFRHLNAHPFLGCTSVYNVVRDRAGFLWFCTNHGLVKYDGKSQQYFTRQNGLPDDMVFDVYEDSQNRLWAFCYNGKYCFIRNNIVHNEHNDTDLAALPENESFTVCMAEDRDSSLYMGFFSRKLIRFKGRQYVFVNDRSNSSASLTISENKIQYTPKPGFGKLATDRRYRLASDDEGIKIFFRDSLIWEVKDNALSYYTVTNFYLVKDQRLIVCTTHGLEIIDLHTNGRIRLLEGIRISGCAADVEGNFWITTLNNGVYVLHQELNNIHLLNGFDGHEWSIVNNGRLVFIKDNTLYELQPDSNELRPVAMVKNVFNYYNPLFLSSELSAFFNTWQKDIRFVRKEGTDVRDMTFFKKMYSHYDGNYFAYGGEMSYFLTKDKGHIHVKTEIDYQKKISASCQHPVSGEIYFISGSGLYRTDFKTARCLLQFSDSLLAGTSSLVLHDSLLLAAKDEQHFYSIYPLNESGRVTTYKPGMMVRDFVSMAKDRIVLTSDGADYLLSTGNGKAGLLQKIQYPFSSSEYEQKVVLGKYYLVLLDGKFYYYDTALLNKRASGSTVYLKQLTINGVDYRDQAIDIWNTSKVDIRLSVGILDFSDDRHAIKYRLLGSEGSNWNPAAATDLNFVLSKPGDYEIQIIPDNNDDKAKSLSFLIHVHTPFFQSTGFIVLCIVLALVLCGVFVYQLISYRKRHFLRELNYLRLEHKAINALLNPHFVFNSINNIQNLIHKSKDQDAAEYLATLSHLIRQNLENLQFNLIPLENELALIERYIKLQNLRFGGRISLIIEGDDDEIQRVQIPPLLMHTFVENSIVHGYRNKQAAFIIKISIRKSKLDYVQIEISDNGVGLNASSDKPAAHMKTSMGISFNQKRLKRLSEFYNLEQSIIVADKSASGGQGTRVVIVLYARLQELFEQKTQPVR